MTDTTSVSAADSGSVWLPIDQLHVWDKNPRKNDGAPVRKVAASIRAFGFVAPIVVWGSRGRMVAGHTRLKALQALLKADPAFVPKGAPGPGVARVLFHEFGSEAEADAYALADNRTAEEADWDVEALGEIVSGIAKEFGGLVEATGFDQDDLDKILSQVVGSEAEPAEVDESRADELREKWGTALAQIWEIQSGAGAGAHRIVCGSSTDADVVSAMMTGSESAELMWTDPPYGVRYVGKTKDALTIQNDALDGDELRRFLAQCYVVASTHALAPGSPVYIAHPAGPLSLQFMLAMLDAGWRIHQGLVWLKDSLVLGRSDYHYIHEPILYGYTAGGQGRRGRGGSGWYGDNAQVSVFKVDRPKRSTEHPTMKPIELVELMLRNSSRPGGIVYEPFSGSGTTMLACEKSGRLCRAVELDPRFVAVALERMQSMGLKPVLTSQVTASA